MTRPIKNTDSICPECHKVIPARIFEEGGVVYIDKECSEHGRSKDVYWGDYDLYVRATKFSHEGTGFENPRTKTVKDCPFDCGPCPQHKSHTVLSIIDVTNRCNLSCPVCFAFAGAVGYVYEPTYEQIGEMLDNLRNNRPVPANAIQFSGGEPTLRKDLPEIVKMAKAKGFRHIEVNTNGIRLAKSVDYCRELKKAGASTIYLQFDGVTERPYRVLRGANLLPTKLKAIENLRKAGWRSIVLVPTLAKGVNDDQLGALVDFAVKNRDIVRSLNIQPVSITGRIDYEKRKEMRITIPDCVKLIENQTKGKIKRTDFYTVPFVVPMAQAIGALRRRGYVEFTAHPHCGTATYIVPDEKGDYKPITRYGDVEELFGAFGKVYEQIKAGKRRRAQLTLFVKALRSVKFEFVRKHLLPIIAKGDYKSLSELHHRLIMIGMMHFMDPYNFDLERAQQCVIHYAVPDGRIISFCTMNTLHRGEVEKKFAISPEQWRKEHGGASLRTVA